MSNHRPGSIHTSGRIGRPFRVEYVNRAGEQVNPHTGKPYARPTAVSNREQTNGTHLQSNAAKGRSVRKALPIKRSGALFGRLKLIPTNPSVDPPPHACFNCWQPGHRKTNCTRPVLSRFCNNCGRRNEDLRTCPRCRDAHQVWLEIQRAKERGENINERLLMPRTDNDDDDDDDDDDEDQDVEAADVEELNDPDEILQELIYQDQRTRELLEYEQRKREQRETLNAIYRNNKLLSEEGAALTFANNREDEYASERINVLTYKKRPSSSVVYKNELDQLLNRDPLMDSDLYENERGSSSFLDQRKPSQQERHIGIAVFENRGQRAHADRVLSREEERVQTPEPERIDGWRQAVADASLVTPDSDPVQDILLLAKTISHLSPETQDLVMRQVINERQEQTKRRAAAQDRQESRFIDTARF